MPDPWDDVALAQRAAQSADHLAKNPGASPTDTALEGARAATGLARDAGLLDPGQAAAAQQAIDAADQARRLTEAVPGVPDLPGVPPVPGLPNVPGVPVVPGVPDVLSMADLPSVPGMPTVPGVPPLPGVPSLPDVPGVPTMPGTPGVPDLPQVPGIPGVPDVPQMPAVPNVPSVPAVPGAPGIPGVPGAPAVPAVPSVPTASVASPAAAPASRARPAARSAGGASGGSHVGGGGPAESPQAKRALRVHTTLGDDAFLLTRLDGDEAVSRPFRFTLDLEADPGDVDAAALLGTPVGVEIAGEGGESAEYRVLHGRVSRFRHVGGGTVKQRYQMEVVPWLWMLSLSADCRTFQKLTVPDIVAQVFKDLGFQDYKLRLVRSYPPREYCVQYRETHLDFVARLLEEEGIFYYFEHEAERHTLVLGDGPSSVRPCPGLPTLRPAPAPGAWAESLHAVYSDVTVERVMHPATVTLADYNYLTPSVSLEASLSADDGQGEVFDYPGKYEAADDGTRYARLRLEGAEAERERAEGASGAPALRSGTTVTLEGVAGDRDWLVLSVRHRASQAAAVAGDDSEFTYDNTFAAVPADTPWRPPRDAPRPRVSGTQSALVVGPAGSEIYTDAQGRVKLHFYWDRQSRRDENSSCWVRCTFAWAGKGWGQFSVPRIGQEVLVDFLEGDPDRPVVVGRVYNADQPPPCDPGGAGGAVSGMRSKSHRGQGYNAVEMHDAAGKEQIAIHAQYDLNTTVQHDETHTVVSGNRKVEVKAGTHTENIKGDTTITVATGAYKLDVQTGTATVHVKGVVAENFDADQTTTVLGNQTATVTHNVKIDGGDKIELVSGDSAITLEKGGKITIHCKTLEIIGDTEIKASAPKVGVSGGDEAKFGVGNQQMTCDKAKVSVSGAAINASAVGTHEITGALVKIN